MLRRDDWRSGRRGDGPAGEAVADPNDKSHQKARKQKRKIKSKPANVKVVVKKYASAHDLRRAFGKRWALKVMPTVLRELMRHADISTTMKYYVGKNAEATADAVGATLVDTAWGNAESSVRNTEKINTGERT